jgi:protein-disulfide isomerase
MNEPSVNQSLQWKSRLELLATILLVLVTLMVGGFALMDRLRPAPSRAPLREVGVTPVLPPISMPLADAPVKGSRGAKVALVLFSDFECPVCARAARELMPRLVARYVDTGKVLLVWRHYPLPIHSSARGAAEAAECADRQGKFWPLHDWAFAHQKELKPDRLRDAAERLGVDMPAFDKCIGGEAAERIMRDIALAKQLDVEGTPTWFFGTVQPDGTVKLVNRIAGLGPGDVYEEVIDRVVQSRQGS